MQGLELEGMQSPLKSSSLPHRGRDKGMGQCIKTCFAIVSISIRHSMVGSSYSNLRGIVYHT